MTREFLQEVAPEKAYRVFNIGATCLVSAAFDGKEGMMPAAWNCPLDLAPFKATVVVDKTHYTRPLIESAECFGLALPSVSIARETLFLGSHSQCDMPDKFEKSGAKFFKLEGFDMPFVDGCVAYAVFKRLEEPDMQARYDLFFGQCVALYADTRVFKDGHYVYGDAREDLRTIHYVAGGHFYVLGREYNLHEFDALG